MLTEPLWSFEEWSSMVECSYEKQHLQLSNKPAPEDLNEYEGTEWERLRITSWALT